MAFKNVIIKRKIADEIFELLPKTSGEQVEVTYGAEVKDLAAVLATVYTDLESWNTFKKDVDFAGADSALDSLRELIDFLSDEDVATGVAAEIAAIKERLTAVEAKAEKNKTDIAALQGTVTALQGTVASNKTAAEEAVAAVDAKAEKNKTDIAALQGTVASNKTAAEEAVAAVDAKAEKNKTDIAALTQTVADNKTAAEEAVAAVDEKADKNAEDIAALTQTVADNKTAAEEAVAGVQGQIDTIKDIQGAQARVIVAEEIPDDLTENDLMLQIV